MVSRNQLRERYRRLMERVGEAAQRSGRRPTDIITVVVVKNATPDQIRYLLELGHADLAENRVQQLQQRVAMAEEFLSRHRMMGGGRREKLPDHVRWHMIGHLQRNKVKPVIGLVKLIHSVDSLRLAEEIQTQAARLDREADVLLQVKIAEEPSKYGVAVPAVAHLGEQMLTMAHLRLRGLMTIAPYSDDPQESRPIFERCAELFSEMRASGTFGESFNILSMGMSSDFEVAIECGANLIRVGRAVFGEGSAEVVDAEQEL